MDFNATIDLIIKDLAEAREIIDDLKKYPGVPALQVELAKSKCKSAGEVIALLKNLRDIIPLVKEEPAQQHVTGENISPDKQVKIAAPEEKKIKKATHIKTTSNPIVEEKELKVIPKSVPESTIVADKFTHLSNRFNEQMGSMKSEEDMSDILKSKPLTSLLEAIGVNDRFLFIREIFNGNKDVYNQAIIRIDNAKDLREAKAVIISYTGDGIENDAVNQLIDLVKRKFPSNE